MPAIIPLAISAATSIAGGVIASKAAKKAAAIQSAAADKASAFQAQANTDILGVQKQQYELGQQRMAPYAALGGQGMALLMGTPQPGAAPAPQNTLGGMMPTGAPPQPGAPPPPGGMPPGPGGGGQMVTLQSPDGETRQVPADQAGFYMSKGARPVGGAGGVGMGRLGGFQQRMA